VRSASKMALIYYSSRALSSVDSIIDYSEAYP
jgi:hypothetical protein